METPNLCRLFPDFSYAQYRKTEGLAIIVDVPVSEQMITELVVLGSSSGKEIILLEPKTLSEQMQRFLGAYQESNPAQTLYVFPGNGAGHAQDLVNTLSPSVKVFAKRFWQPGNDPLVQVGEICPERFLLTEWERIVVVDDVISSGQTMAKLKQRNCWKFPKAEWIGASWISQVPRMSSRAGVNGYRKIFTALVLEGLCGQRAKINSLSTLVNDPEIAVSYATRHFYNPKLLLRVLDSLRV